MFGSPILDIVTGLIFVFLLYSLLATIIQELIATWMGMRAKTLEKAIIRMLNDGKTDPTRYSRWWSKFLGLFATFFISSFDRIKSLFFIKNGTYKDSLAEKFYQQSSIKFLAEDSWHSKPDYLDAKNFSKALLDILRGEDVKPGDDLSAKIYSILYPETDADKARLVALKIEPDTLKQLQSFLVDANNDLEKFKNYLEEWFDSTMKRTTGWYKRHVQFILFIIGFGIAIVFNVDAIKIASTLSKDKNAREQLVELAKGSEKYQTVTSELDSIGKINDSIITQADIKRRQKYLNDTYDKVLSDANDVSSILALGWKIPFEKNQKFCDDNFKKDRRKYYKCTTCMTKYEGAKYRQLGFFEKIGFIWKTQVSWKTFIGWLISALAISLGAPFWFDLLNKFMKLRTTGKKPDDKNDATKVKPEAVG